MHYAHSTPDGSKVDWQGLAEHLAAVADLAARFAAPLGLERAARLAGLLHDLGKYTPGFQARLAGGASVDHSTAGAAEVLARLRHAPPADRMMAEVVAYAILGHHAGLPDRSGDSGLADRIERHKPGLDPVWQQEIAPDATGLFPHLLARGSGDGGFRLGFLGRMLFSCLVDADYRDTEAFYVRTGARSADRDWPALADSLPDLIARYDSHMAGMAAASDVNRLRRDILAHVRGQASLPPGLFTLTVPTGGGKTLASLGFALDHARRHGHRRIIYAIPFTSIIDQTAAIFRQVLGDGPVLEHHSAIEEDRDTHPAGREKLRLAMEDWAAPIVVTTTVQLFESLFANRPGRCRKLHNIAGSIIILDEAQTLPRPLLGPCVRAIAELAQSYACSIVLCTATQPALDQRHHPPRSPLGLPLEGRELAPDPAHLARALRRVTLRQAGPLGNAGLVAALGAATQGLVIVNSRKHAFDLYREAVAAGLDGMVHLSTRQCAADRRIILEDIRARLKAGRPCRVVATSLVEAGVDVDFPAVWRAEAGLDQIAQAAGRCNREGRRDPALSFVTVFSAPDYPPPAEIRGLAGDMDRAARDHADLMSPEAMERYFAEVYWRLDKGVDKHELLGMFKTSGIETNFAYRTVAGLFRMIDSGMLPVIIAESDDAQAAVDRLGIADIPSGLCARELQSFIVQVPPQMRAKLISCGHVAFAAPDLRGDQFAVLKPGTGLYRAEVGLDWDDAEYLAVENTIL